MNTDNLSFDTRPCDIFLRNRGTLLGMHGFIPDAGRVERTATENIVFYHYTRPEHVQQIFSGTGGLWARLNVVHCDTAPEFVGCYLIEGLLEPLPSWITHSPYFGDFGLEMMCAYVGNVLLRIEVPAGFPGLYVADAAHNFECQYMSRKGKPALHLGYNCRNGAEVCLAEINSYIPICEYRGGHVAPNVKVMRLGEGIAVPREFISVCDVQPLRDDRQGHHLAPTPTS